MAHVGGQIRLLREEKGWTQPRLSVETGLAVSGISQIENGRRNPNAATLAKLARALGVEVADLFPKAEAPLPSEEADGQRHSPFVGAFIAYIYNRTHEWEETVRAFERSEAEGSAEEILAASEVAQSEFNMLLAAIVGAVEACGGHAIKDCVPTGLTSAEALVLGMAVSSLRGVMNRWNKASDAAFSVISAASFQRIQEEHNEKRALEKHQNEAAMFEERAKRVAQEHQKVVEIFEELLSA